MAQSSCRMSCLLADHSIAQVQLPMSTAAAFAFTRHCTQEMLVGRLIASLHLQAGQRFQPCTAATRTSSTSSAVSRSSSGRAWNCSQVMSLCQATCGGSKALGPCRTWHDDMLRTCCAMLLCCAHKPTGYDCLQRNSECLLCHTPLARLDSPCKLCTGPGGTPCNCLCLLTTWNACPG